MRIVDRHIVLYDRHRGSYKFAEKYSEVNCSVGVSFH